MSGALRIYRRPRALRFGLLNRQQQLLLPLLRRRAESTTADASSKRGSSSSSSAFSSSPAARPSFVKRNFSRIVWSWLGGMLGVVGGTLVVHTLAPPRMPEPGTHQDNVLMADLDRRIDEEFKIKVLRGKCLGVAKQLKGEDGGWLEVIGLPSLAESDGSDKSEEHGDLVSHLQGAKGFGVERLFWDRGERKLVAIVWFGSSLCGWPGNAHGGVLATALEEKMALANLLSDSEHTDVLAAATPQRLPGTGNHAKMLHPSSKPEEPTEISISYVNPTHANQFMVIRVAPSLPLDTVRGHMIPLNGGGAEFDAMLETMDGKVCVKAKATFNPSTSEKSEAAGGLATLRINHEKFKEWMWPSRQKNSQG